MNFHFHPHVTRAAIAAGLTSIATEFAVVRSDLSTALRSTGHADEIVAGIGVIAGMCLLVAGFGQGAGQSQVDPRDSRPQDASK